MMWSRPDYPSCFRGHLAPQACLTIDLSKEVAKRLSNIA
jgi:hypothetical protein